MKIFFRHIVLSLFFLLTINTLSAKTNDTIIDKNLQIEFRASYGFTLCHHPEMKYFQAHYPIYELSLQQATFGRKSWQSKCNYPFVGITLLYSDLGGFKEVGSVYALYPYMAFNCLKSQKNQLNFKLGIGLGILTNHYDPITNPKNTFIGSTANAAINLTCEYNRFITKRLSLSAFMSFSHFSNGARRAPNKGINIAHTGIAAKYFINEPHDYIPKLHSDFQKKISLYAAITYSIKELNEYIGYDKRFPVYILHINGLKSISEIIKLGVGLDVIYDKSDLEVLKFKDIPAKPIDIVKPGINIAYEMCFGSTSFMINIGYHLAGKAVGDEPLYQKIQAMQNITKHLYATCGLISHFGRADNFCFGLGYRIM